MPKRRYMAWVQPGTMSEAAQSGDTWLMRQVVLTRER